MEYKQVSWEFNHTHNKPDDGTTVGQMQDLSFHRKFGGTSNDIYGSPYLKVNASQFREVPNVR